MKYWLARKQFPSLSILLSLPLASSSPSSHTCSSFTIMLMWNGETSFCVRNFERVLVVLRIHAYQFGACLLQLVLGVISFKSPCAPGLYGVLKLFTSSHTMLHWTILSWRCVECILSMRLCYRGIVQKEVLFWDCGSSIFWSDQLRLGFQTCNLTI